MKMCRFKDRLDLVMDENALDVTEALKDLPQFTYPFPQFDLSIENPLSMAPRFTAAAKKEKSYPLKGFDLLSPIANPGKVIAAPINYKKHIEEALADHEIQHRNKVAEIQHIGLFLKATSSVVGPGEGVMIRHVERRTDHEIELAVVIGKRGDRLTRAIMRWNTSLPIALPSILR